MNEVQQKKFNRYLKFIPLLAVLILSGLYYAYEFNNQNIKTFIKNHSKIDPHAIISYFVDSVYMTDQQVFQYKEDMDYRSQKNNIQQSQLSFDMINKQFKTKHFNVTKIVWLFQDLHLNLNFNDRVFQALNLLNNKRYLQKGQYKIITINKKNYTTFLSKQNKTRIDMVLRKVKTDILKIQDEKIRKQYDKELQQIKKRLIIYFVLLQNGGVYMHSKMTLVENLSDWLDNILELPYINVGDRINSTIQPKFFAFFDQQRSSFRSKVNVKRQYEFEKKMHIFPSLQERFFACQKGNEYLKKIIDAYISILTRRQFSKEWKMTNKNGKIIGAINPKQIYQQGHMIANHAVLQKKQSELDKYSSKLEGKYRRLAIDDFGLITMNMMLGSLRHYRAWPSWRRYPQYAYLSKYTLQQLQRQIGPTRFMRLLDYQHYKAIAQRFINNWSDKENFVAKNSFVDKFYLQSLPQDKKITIQGKVYMINPPVRLIEYNDANNIDNAQWIQVPKHFWIVWDDGINDDSNINFLVRMCIQNLRKSAQNSGMQFHIVSNFTIKDYLSEQTYNRIQTARNNSGEKIWRQLTGDLWRLGLMYQHGGIYVDASTFALQQNYDWVYNITRIPSSFLWNRYGQKPDVLMLWNDFYAAPTNWQFDDKIKTKKAWHLSYESNFIAAKKNSKFIKDWMDTFLQFVITPQYQVTKLLKSSRAGGQIWNMRYLIIMDSMIYTSLKKQQELQKTNNTQYANAADYYKLWSLNGYQMSHLKYRNQLNFQNKDYRNFYGEHLNIYNYERSQYYTQSVIGKNYFQNKFYTMAKSLNTMMMINYKNHEEKSSFKLQRLSTVFQDVVHPDSLIGKYLIYKNTTITKLVMDEFLHKELKINQRTYHRFSQ